MGYPKLILSDGGAEFENDLARELYRILGVHKVKTSPYRPSANGQVENLHRTLNSLLSKIIHDNQRDWPQFISHVMFCYNTAVHGATGFSPYFLMTGRVASSSIDMYMPDCGDNGEFSVAQFANDTANRLAKAYESVREHLKTTSERFSEWYNRGIKPKVFAVGDKVRVYNPRKFRRKSPKWQSYFGDVATVKARLKDVTYLVSCTKWRSDRIVHVDKLKPVLEFKVKNIMICAVDVQPSPVGASAMESCSSPASVAHSVDRDWGPLLCPGANQHPGDVSVVVTNTGDLSDRFLLRSNDVPTDRVRVDGLSDFALF